MRSGAYGSGNPALPFTPGSAAAAVVVSVGGRLDAGGSCLYHRDDHRSLCGVGVVQALPGSPLARPDETLLVHGAGGVSG